MKQATAFFLSGKKTIRFKYLPAIQSLVVPRVRRGLNCILKEAPVAKKIYVGNLPYTTTDSDLQAMFEQHGTVQSAQVIADRDTGRSKGFGFVEMASDGEAQAAIDALNGTEMEGRALTVNEARPRVERSGGGGGGGRGGRRY